MDMNVIINVVMDMDINMVGDTDMNKERDTDRHKILGSCTSTHILYV